MPGILVRMLITLGGIGLAAAIVPSIEIRGTGTLLAAAILLGVVNAIVRPVVIVLTFPITVVTLGLFLWVINAAMLGLVASMLDDFTVGGFFPALLGALLVSLTSWVASWYIGPDGRFEILVVERRD